MRMCVSVAAVLALAGAASAQVYIPFGTSTGSLGVYYNTASPETPANQRYFRAQNSPSNTNGATFNFDSAADLVPSFPGVQSMYSIFQAVPDQFGIDLVLPAPTATGPAPTITARDNVNGSVAGAASAGPVFWGISGYTGSTDGPSNPANAIINTLFRSNNATPAVLSFNTVPIAGGFQTTVSGFLVSDGTIYWYNPATANSAMSAFFNDGTLYASGRIKVDGVLTYITGDDTTPGADFYNGTITYQLELIPAPGAAALLGLGGLCAARRRR